jgi:hypothetical protein
MLRHQLMPFLVNRISDTLVVVFRFHEVFVLTGRSSKQQQVCPASHSHRQVCRFAVPDIMI